MLKFIRNFHLYSGLFFTPAIIFFAVSGALQTFGLHENREGVYTAPEWIAAIAEVHKNQRLHQVLPDKPPPTDVKEVTSEKQQKAPSSSIKRGTKRPKSFLLQIFIVLMSTGLIASALTGIYMAFKFKRNTKLIVLLLSAGTLVPVAFLFL